MPKETYTQMSIDIESLINNIATQFEDQPMEKWEDIFKEAKSLAQKNIEEKEKQERLAKELEEKEKQERLAKELEELNNRKREVEEMTCMDLPLDWENTFASDSIAAGLHVDSIADGLILSLTELGSVDIEFIAQVSGVTYKNVIETLKGSIYQNPDKWDECFYKGWETSDEYLSGNLIRKRKKAVDANVKYCDYFIENVAAIDKVLPVQISSEDIYVTLGSPWIPSDIISDFIQEMFGFDFRYGYGLNDESYKVQYEKTFGTWVVPHQSHYGDNIVNTLKYGTDRIKAISILEKTLNGKSIKIYDTVKNPVTKKSSRVLNMDETVLVSEKQELQIKAFKKWVWEDPVRKERLENIYYEKFGCINARNFDGGFLKFPNLSPNINLYKYQKDAVARILFTPNTLLAHDVGAGKTYTMIAAGMELRRMNISKKNVFVVPNNIVGQWKKIFTDMYPDANVMSIEPKSFKKNKRDNVIQDIRDKDFDAIIIAYSCFELIKLSPAYYEKKYLQELKYVDQAINELGSNRGVRLLRKRKVQLKRLIEDAREEQKKSYFSTRIYFDNLGINTLFIDEAHNYKNIPLNSKINNILGINMTGSKKCAEMLYKSRCVQRENNGRGLVLATGTPISNSITDLFNMQSFLQYGELKLLNLQIFDNWVATFGEKQTEIEIDVDTSAFRLGTRFSSFHNLPELSSLLAQVADFHHLENDGDLPGFNGYEDVLIGKTTELSDYIKHLSSRADDVRRGVVDRTSDNMLKITTDGRKAALDMRLTDPAIPFTYQSKVATCAEKIAAIYRKTSANNLSQLVFCDYSTPKDTFNLYDELRRLLIELNIPPSDIAFIHDYGTDKERNLLFSKVQKGEIRILIGSTFKLGIGVNVQDLLIAIHHLDVPWRPSDMIQREGRILRAGNTNQEVHIYRYISESSFDSYSWQLLEIKQRFISQILNNSVGLRSGSDIDDTTLNYAEVKALAVGNPMIKKRVEQANDLSKLIVMQKTYIESRLRLGQELEEIPREISRLHDVIDNAQMDLEHYISNRIDTKKMKNRDELRFLLADKIASNALMPREVTIFNYQGFSIVTPSNMSAAKPFVWIVGKGKYHVELGDSEVGGLIRIDNKLNSFGKFIEDKEKRIADLSARAEEIKKELVSETSYHEEIEEAKNKLATTDKALKVVK